MFIEETGKTGVTNLINLGPPELLIEVTAGDNVELRANDNKLEVYDEDGQFVGQVEPKLAKRLLGLMAWQPLHRRRHHRKPVIYLPSSSAKPTSTPASAASSRSRPRRCPPALTAPTCVRARSATAWRKTRIRSTT